MMKTEGNLNASALHYFRLYIVLCMSSLNMFSDWIRVVPTCRLFKNHCIASNVFVSLVLYATAILSTVACDLIAMIELNGLFVLCLMNVAHIYHSAQCREWMSYDLVLKRK